MACSMARSLELIGDWWTPLIIRDLQLGLDRFDALADNLGISRNLLAARLAPPRGPPRGGGGLGPGRGSRAPPPGDGYVPTGAGQEVVPVLMALTAWGDGWATPEGGPPLVFRHRHCGHEFTPTVSCDACGQPVRPGETEVLP